MAITLADVEYVAKLAKLDFSPAEQEQMVQKLDSILDYMHQLQEVDTTDVPATTHVLALENVFREDEVRPGLPHQEAVQNAPAYQDGYFRVPRIL